jgi:hypothetical protein
MRPWNASGNTFVAVIQDASWLGPSTVRVPWRHFAPFKNVDAVTIAPSWDRGANRMHARRCASPEPG